MAKITKEQAKSIITGTNKLDFSIDLDNYNNSLSKILNHLNNTWSTLDYKKSSIDYAISIGMDINKNIPDYMFRCIGAICYLILKDCKLRIDDIQRAIFKLNEIQELYEKTKSKIETLDIIVEQPKLEFDETIDFKNMIDDDYISNIINNKPISIDKLTLEYIKCEFSKKNLEKILEFINIKIKEYSEYKLNKNSKDEQWKESLSGISLATINKVLSFLNELVEKLQTTSVKQNITKKVTKKDKPAIVQVAKMQYTKEWEFIKSILPKDCVGTTEIWLYDVETRDLSVLRSLKDTKFVAEGMTFGNVDESKSFKKKLRTPIEQLHTFMNGLQIPNKKSFNSIFTQIKTKEQTTSGRMSSSKIIIQTFN